MLSRFAKESAVRVWREESGIAFIWLILLIPVVVILAAFVINVANWFEHKRHLQMQVDAAALAAGGKWVFTQRSNGTTTCSDSDLENESLIYAGDLTRNPLAFNQQVSNENNVHVLFNSPSYWSSPADSALENTDPAGAPCTAGFIDVKATDDKPPVFFGGFGSGLRPSVHAHARVDFFVADFLGGSQLLPLAVPDPTPKHAYAYFVNETSGARINDSSGNPLPAVPLFYSQTSGGVDYWTSVDTSGATPVYHTDTIPSMPAGNVGVRVALSGSLTNNQCGQPLVTCYDVPGTGNPAANGTTPLFGIDNIRTFDASATPGTGSPQAAMTVYGAKLTSGDCTNPYFPTADCSVRLHMQVKFAAGITTSGNNKLTVQARVDGATQNNKQFTMAPGASTDCPAANPAGSLCYESTQDIPLTGVSSGQWHTIDVAWSDTLTTDSLGATACKNGGGNPCDDTGGTGKTAQRVFYANATNAGPLKSVDILDTTQTGGVPTPIRAEQPGSTAFHSYAIGDSATLGVQIGIQQAFATASPTSPPVTLRAGAGAGSQTQALDCNPSTGSYVAQYQAKYGNNTWNNTYTHLDGELQFGCVPTYAKWDGTTQCPGAASGTLYPGDRGVLWGTTQPWFCAAATTGDINSAIGPGLNGRILGDPNASTCPPLGPTIRDSSGNIITVGSANGHNNWDPKDPVTGLQDPNWTPQELPDGDPRIVFLFLTPFGTFNSSGSDTYPVIRFATFYITGWQSKGGGNNNPCQGAGGGDDPAPSAGVVGHFMSYAAQDTGGSTTGTHCTDPSGIDVCIAVLTQ